MTVVVCPNDVVQQWGKSILEIFPDSVVTSGKDAFFVKYNKDKYSYLILNYDKFSQEDSPNLILSLARQKVDFVIIDEVHFVKKRDEDSSLRRRNLDGLMTAIKKKNSQVKVLGLSATPVINNLMEGRSLLELITAKIYDDVAITPTIPNAVTLYEKLSTISIRELPQYSIDLRTEHINVEAKKPPDISIKQLKTMEAVKWLERLERGEISSVTRRDLNVELAPIEVARRIKKYGDFTRLNNQINNENSETTHHRMVRDPRGMGRIPQAIQRKP
jgi:hypothetical protein